MNQVSTNETTKTPIVTPNPTPVPTPTLETKLTQASSIFQRRKSNKACIYESIQFM